MLWSHDTRELVMDLYHSRGRGVQPAFAELANLKANLTTRLEGLHELMYLPTAVLPLVSATS